jgi:Na+/proline symporter
MITKFYTIKDTKSVKHATVISTVFCAVIGCGAYFVGSLSRLVLSNTLPEGGHDAVIPQMLLAALGNGKLTMIILAVILILLLSASMSTLASIVLSSSSAISVDLLPEFTKKLQGKKQISVTRLLCLLFVTLSFIFATANISVIVNIMSFSWGVVAGCFIGPYLWGLFSKKVTRTAVWVAMLLSMLTVAIPTVIITVSSGFSAAVSKAPEMGVFAMLVSIVTVPIVSLFTKKYPDEHINKIFKSEKEEK